MKLHSIDLPYGKKKHLYSTPQIVSLGGLVFIFLTIVTLYSASFSMRSSLQSLPSSSSSDEVLQSMESVRVNDTCDLFTGDWVPNPNAPYYTNDTCTEIYNHQNCLKYERPDLDFLKWRWKPDDCELPIFDPVKFLELVRGKSLAFVGDSVARNHMQSLICLLSRAESPIEVTNSTDQQSKRYEFPNHDFILANFWSPFLVKASEPAVNSKLFTLHLDEFDESWTTKIEQFDYLIISGGHWFFRPSTLYEESQPIGCHYCSLSNVTELGGHRKAFRTAFRAINSLKNYKAVTFLRTFAPSHFEKGAWNEGGNCVRTRPYKRNETSLEETHQELYTAQMEEFKVAQEEAVKRGLKFRLLDTTEAMLRRPDGHPSTYGRPANLDWASDCVHWCLPGPIDTFNDLLLEMMRREGIQLKGGSL